MPKLTRILIALLMTLAFGLTSVFAQADEESLRFVHVIPGVSAVDVYVDGQLTVTNLGYGEASSYIATPTGSQQITVRPSGLTTNLWSQTVQVNAGQPLTLIASTTNPLEFIAFEDDFSSISLGTTRFKAIHAISGGPAVDLLAGEDTVGAGLNYGDFAGTFDVPADSYDLTIVPAGGSADDAIITAAPFSLISGTSQMLIVYGTGSTPDILMLTAPTAGADDAGFVRLAHGIADGPTVDIYADDIVLAAGVDFGQVTEHLAVPAGSYTVELRAAGTSTVLIEGTLEVEAGTAQTAVAVLDDDTPTVAVFDDAIAGITPDTAFVSVINTISGDSSVTATLSDGTVLAEDVAFGSASELVTLEPTAQTVNFTLTLDGQSADLSIPTVKLYGGVYYNVLALDGTSFSPPTLLFVPTALAQAVASAPGAERMAIAELPDVDELEEIEEPVDEPETVVEEPVDEPELDTETEIVTAPEPEEPEQPAVVATPRPAGPTARILLDPGVNLQLREYPSSQARSLGLAPSGSTVGVNGRVGAPIDLDGDELPILDEDGQEIEFVDPATLLEDDRDDLVREETWVNITYDTPDGGQIIAWTNALYLAINAPDGTQQRLADLPMIPQNRPGEAIDTAVTPPPIPEDSVTVRTVNLDPGVNVNIRRTPERTGEVLVRIPNNTATEFLGLGESGDWAFVRYTTSEGGIVSGWISTQYIIYEFRDREIDLDEMETRGLLEIVDEEALRGSISAGVQPAVQPTRDPTRDAFVASVEIDADANLNLRRTPNVQGEVIERIPSGTQLIIDGRTEDAEWLRTEFEGQVGWISSGFVFVTFNGAAVELDEIPIVTIEVETDDETEGDEG